jgi:hypothetical protein
MPPKKVKSVTVDTMVHYFIQKYKIPTRKDVDKLNRKLDNIERLLKELTKYSQITRTTKKMASVKSSNSLRARKTATNAVIDIIKKVNREISFNEIRMKSGFDDKKVRNIIFRMHKLGRIERVKRGVYRISKKDVSS